MTIKSRPSTFEPVNFVDHLLMIVTAVAWDLASLASIIVKGLRRKEWTIKLPFNINVLSTYNVITRLTDFIAWT